jgi:Sec-independent protein secretion pathway component TatC
LNGDEAIAHAARVAGVNLGIGYPGTPSTEILETFSALGGYAQWAPNEKVAAEVAIGAALAGGKAVIFSSLLFIAGALFIFYVILPILMRFAFSFANANLQPTFGLANFLGLAGGLMLAGGLIFQLPLVIIVLNRLGVVEKDKLKRARPYVIVILLIVAAIATPPDVISQLLLFFPAYALFELGLLFTR